MTGWPLLATFPQPAIGEKRTIKGWARHGVWYLWKHNSAVAWLDKWTQTLQALFQQRRVELLACQQQVSSLQQQRNELTVKHEETRQEIKAQYQKTEHRKERVGELPVVEEKTRISITRPVGGFTSTTESVHETPFLEWVDEPEQTPDQRRDEIAGEIAMLPDYVARVKIKDENDELVEYTIRTLKPEPGLRGRALEERILQIKKRMVRDNILRPRHEIDEEIRERQQLLRLPQLKPSETQANLPPPEDEPPIKRRG